MYEKEITVGLSVVDILELPNTSLSLSMLFVVEPSLLSTSQTTTTTTTSESYTYTIHSTCHCCVIKPS